VGTPDSDRVAEILEAACRVIARDGWHGLRMDAVAREAGVSKALVHYYFVTRDALLRAAFAHSEDRANTRVEAEVALADSPADKLERFLLLDYEPEAVFTENRALWSEVWAGMRLDEGLRPDVEERYRAWLERLVELVEEAEADANRAESNGSHEDIAYRLAALIDGVDSLLLVGLMTAEKARALVRESVANELGTPASATGDRQRELT
jgi:AcrR family transcriptional regulator